MSESVCHKYLSRSVLLPPINLVKEGSVFPARMCPSTFAPGAEAAAFGDIAVELWSILKMARMNAQRHSIVMFVSINATILTASCRR